MPNRFATGLIVNVRVEPEPLNAMLATLLGTRVVLNEVTVTEETFAPPPTLKVN